MVPHSSSFRAWYMDGNYLVILVSVTIILPLALMRQLGESPGSAGGREGTCKGGLTLTVLSSAGYLGYSSGFSLSCMVFFLIAVSHLPCWSGGSSGPRESSVGRAGQGWKDLLGSQSEKAALLSLNMASW